MENKYFILTLMAGLGIAFSSMAQTLPSYVPTNELAAWYSFSGNANDGSGHGQNGTVNGAILTTDRFGKQNSAYSFSTNQKITVANSGGNNYYPMTISLWYQVIPSQTGENWYGTLFNKYVNASWNGYRIHVGDYRNIGNRGTVENHGFAAFPFYLSGATNRLIGFYGEDAFLQPFIDLNTWYHFVFVVDDNGGRIYANNKLVSSHPWTGSPKAATSDYQWEIGGGDGGEWYSGKIDDVGVWNRALTEDEIDGLFNAGICFQVITVTDTLVINANITGYNPIQFANTIKIFPNPTKDMITIDCGDNYDTMNGYKIEIVNSTGQKLIENRINRQHMFVDLSTLSGKGLYFVHLIDDKGNTIDLKKIILQ